MTVEELMARAKASNLAIKKRQVSDIEAIMEEVYDLRWKSLLSDSLRVRNSCIRCARKSKLNRISSFYVS